MDTLMMTSELPVEAGTSKSQGAGKRHKALMSQVNARIETAVKSEADAAFYHAGIAPSEAIRTLYARAAALGSSLRSVDDLVVSSSDDVDAVRSREAVFEHASHAFGNTIGRYGFSVDIEGFEPMTEEEIEDSFYQDYLADDAL